MVLQRIEAAFAALPPPPTPRKLSTEPVRRVLERLGRPQDRLPPVVHIAGTNGKGSTTAFMRAIAEAHGLAVHVDTSPHLVRVNERIRIAGRLIEDDAFLDLIDEVLLANNGAPLSFYEGTTAAALLAFSRAPADLCLIEVGLGGRFDSTNVFDRPAVCAITPVDLDHKDMLGDTIAQIAWEKAGILKSGVPAVSAPQHEDARRVLLSEAREVGAHLSFIEDEAGFGLTADGFVYRSGRLSVSAPRLGLAGPHQAMNAALASSALQAVPSVSLNAEAVATGLAKVSWPARLQRLKPGPLTDDLPEGTTLWLDGGHNPHAGRALATHFSGLAPVPVIVAMLERKDAAAFFREIAPVAGPVCTIPIPGEHKGFAPEALAGQARAAGIDAGPAGDIRQALKRAADAVSGQPPGHRHILICGSLYLAGHVLAMNGEQVD